MGDLRHVDLGHVAASADVTVTVTGPSGPVAVGAIERDERSVWADWVPAAAGDHVVRVEAVQGGAVYRERTTVEVGEW